MKFKFILYNIPRKKMVITGLNKQYNYFLAFCFTIIAKIKILFDKQAFYEHKFFINLILSRSSNLSSLCQFF